MTVLRAFFGCFFEAETRLEKSTKKTNYDPKTLQNKPVLSNEREARRKLKNFLTCVRLSRIVFSSLGVGKRLRISFFGSFRVSTSLSLSVSPSLDGCLSVVAVDLQACREHSKGAVALHGHEVAGGGRRAASK